MNSPLFGICLSLVIYLSLQSIQKRLKSSLLNPLFFSSIVIILILLILNIPYESYNIGGSMISVLINPATVALAIPLYKHKEKLIQYKKVIFVGVTSGVLAHAISIGFLAIILNLSPDIITSLIPKSVTTAIAQDISANMGGIPIITICTVIVTGIFGAALSPSIVKFFKLDNDISIGLALGTSAHAVGTSRAIETNETQATMATLALILTGILTVITAPIVNMILLGIIR